MRKKDQEDQIVTKSNALARASWKAGSIWEGRVLAISALKVRANEEIKTIRIMMSELLMGTDLEIRDKTKEEIKLALKKAIGRHITIHEPEKDKTTYTVIFREFVVNKKDNYIEVLLEERVKDHFLNLQGYFTQYNIEEYQQLTSTYAQRVYEFLCSWSNYEEPIQVSLFYMQEMLKVPPSHKQTFGEFDRRVLRKAYMEIHANPNATFSYNYYPVRSTKQGRPVIAIIFVIFKCKNRNKEDYYQEDKNPAAISNDEQKLPCQQSLAFETETSEEFRGLFSHALATTVNKWLIHCREKNQIYKPTAYKTLIKTIKEKADAYGDDAVIYVIEQTITAPKLNRLEWQLIKTKPQKKPDDKPISSEQADEIINAAKVSQDTKDAVRRWIKHSNCNVIQVVKQVEHKSKIIGEERIIDDIEWAIAQGLAELRF